MYYTGDTWDQRFDHPKKFRSLASAVNYVLQAKKGIVGLPDGQRVYIEDDDDIIEVHHRSHPSDRYDKAGFRDSERGSEGPGLQRVAGVVRRFRPDAEVSIWDE
ncbi:hypothetical protein LCGC14_2815190 [marine sediment metagenome]|uniref:Uncharacterized protein n=1 Tax=marine sediment metagenome TaxID=412755 RepID=A0A0F8YIP8_9ZZZZ